MKRARAAVVDTICPHCKEPVAASQLVLVEDNYSEAAEVNGINIEVFLHRPHGYVVYLPQIDGADGINNQMILLNEDPETAKKAFRIAKAWAASAGSALELFEMLRSSLYSVSA